MRAPFQILAIPYKMVEGLPLYCVFRRANFDQWQFIAGGGEQGESPREAARREILEEAGVQPLLIKQLVSMSYIPASVISLKHRKHWREWTYVIPEYTFAFECNDDIKLSEEHTEFLWLEYDSALEKLKWDSNRTALYELNCKLLEGKLIGLKKGTVKLCEHREEWEVEAQRTISHLLGILGEVITDIQHVGSTAIPTIKAKPIIDIAVAVDDFDAVLAFTDDLQENGYYYRPNSELAGQMLFARGSCYDYTGDMQTHFIHIVKRDSREWNEYIGFRDHLISHPAAAKEYEALKVALAERAPVDAGREKYSAGKHDFIVGIINKLK